MVGTRMARPCPPLSRLRLWLDEKHRLLLRAPILGRGEERLRVPSHDSGVRAFELVPASIEEDR